MTIKPSEFYKQASEIRTAARDKADRAARVESFFRDVARRIQADIDRADTQGLPADAASELDIYYRLLEDGPPDGSPLGGEAAQVEPKPPVQRRERQACPRCGLKRGHKPDCPEYKASAIRERNEEGRAEGDARTKLAGRIRQCRDDNPGALPSEIADALGEPLQAIRDAWPLLTGEKAP